jgi:hypothetical protein
MFLWNNLHGEFISGFLVTGATMAGWMLDYIFDHSNASITVLKRLGSIFAIITIVTLVNPVSFRALSTVTSWLGNDYLMSHTNETNPPNFSDPRFLILLVFLVFSIFILSIKHEKIPARMGIIFAGFTALVLFSARNVHLFGIVAPFILMKPVSGKLLLRFLDPVEMLLNSIESQLKGILWPILTVVIGTFFLIFSPLAKFERFSPTFFPVQASTWLKSNPQDGNMFNPFDWGGYLSLELWPEKLVFIDSQGDIYGESFIRDYAKVVALEPGWQSVLVKYNVQWALLPNDWALGTALKDAGWHEVYRDNVAIILVDQK